MVEWILEPDREGCRYTFSHHGMSRRDIPDEEGVAVGWHLWLDDLEGHVSESIEASSHGRANELARAYRKRLGEVLG